MYIPCILLWLLTYIITIEYIGNIPAEKREEVIKQLNEESARLIQVAIVTAYIIVYVYICS